MNPAAHMPRRRVVVVLGPTAGGKSDLAVAIAQQFNGEIINADSMQVYRQLDAGTAKPTAAQRAAAPHHLVDVVEPTEPFTVADWLERAERLIVDLHARGTLPVVVGGTNLYLKALLEGMFEGPPADAKFRATVAEVPAAELHERLRRVDPDAAERIHPNDHKRLVRALEVYHTTGQPISAQQTQWGDQARRHEGTEERRDDTSDPSFPPQASSLKPQASASLYRHDPILIGLQWPAESINRRINARVKQMFHPPAPGIEDLITETRRLKAAGLLGPQAREAIGTKQVLAHLRGEYSADDAMEQVKIETRRFAKAQRTWLKRYRGVHWLDPEPPESPEELTRRAIEIVAGELKQ